MITIDEAREILSRARGQAERIYDGESKMALQAIDYLFVVVDTELLRMHKVELRKKKEEERCEKDMAE